MFLPFIILRGQRVFIYFYFYFFKKKDLYQDKNVIFQIFLSEIF
jgi:hypothetical protein